MQQRRTCPVAGHVRQRCGARPLLHVNRGTARVGIGRAYILIMMFISKIIYIMKEMFLLCGKPVGLGGKLQ